MNVDVAIVGAGPAGLAASIELARAGLSVAVVDEYYRPGGRLLGQLYDDPQAPAGQRRWDGRKVAAELLAQARQWNVQVLSGVTAWSVQPSWQIELSGAAVQTLRAKALLLATGACEKALPIPGWTLPGVVSIGAAQTFTNLHRVAIGRRVMVVGADPLALSVALEMKHAGIEVVGVALPPQSPWSGELASPVQAVARLAEAADLAPHPLLRRMGRLAAGRLRALAAHALRWPLLRLAGVPLYLRQAVTRIEGSTAVEAVTLQPVSIDGVPTGRAERVAVDAVCLSAGLYPLIDLAQVAGCTLVELPELGGLVPLHSRDLRTSVEGLYVAGNITGIEGAKVAMAQGRLAAVSIAAAWGKTASLSLDEALAAVEAARARSPLRFLPRIAEGRAKMEQLWQAAHGEKGGG
ncbi:NAD(P)/FAD-dependent oxidoreductase [Brevibacillus marinus]|uniref:NAD(P)/FAD-dependent oxidoreductase n=1 Tax=Brevibacillus marinus TaxID=2496837 RepID=UPI0013E0A178|nr:NAD(P)/FAD-dependent oxidoreductase [Brevibacillus marinus]